MDSLAVELLEFVFLASGFKILSDMPALESSAEKKTTNGCPFGLPKFRHYRRSRKQKAPRKRTFVMHMVKYVQKLLPSPMDGFLGVKAGLWAKSFMEEAAGREGALYPIIDRIWTLTVGFSLPFAYWAAENGSSVDVLKESLSVPKQDFRKRGSLLASPFATFMGPTTGLSIEDFPICDVTVPGISFLNSSLSSVSPVQPSKRQKLSSGSVNMNFENSTSSLSSDMLIFQNGPSTHLSSASSSSSSIMSFMAFNTGSSAIASGLESLSGAANSAWVPAAYVESSVAGLSLLERIDSGAYGTIYKGTLHGALVAVKVVNYEEDMKVQEDYPFKSFETEMNILSTVQHPNVIQLICGVPPANGTPFIVMEYAEFGSMEILLRRPELLQAASTAVFMNAGRAAPKLLPTSSLGYLCLLQLLKETCQALHYLHSLNKPVVHRDVKLANILVDSNGAAKLIDFGSAAYLGQTSGSHAIGTAQYAAPEELWTTAFAVGPAADIFSVGVCLWEVASGKTPWIGIETASVIYSVGAKDERLPLDAIQSPALRELVKKCWATNPADRPMAIEVCDGLEQEIVRIFKSHSN